jgi:hypothetical protein
MHELHRLGIKLFASSPIQDVRLLVPVFHEWIQRQAVRDHLLLDVHDYSHIYHGPGILLVGHEGNFSLDLGDGRQGLLYFRKQPLAGGIEDKLATVLKTTMEASDLLEADTPIRLSRNELMIVSNDRLCAPNQPETFEALQPIVVEGLNRAFPGSHFNLTSAKSEDSSQRLAIHARRINTPSL